jgi:hypothetical protein
MDNTTVVILGVIALIVIIAIFALAGSSRPVPRAELQPLTLEARDRYAMRWDQIESRFVEAPEQAVREAEALVLALLGERGHPLAENRLPAGVRKARRETSRGSTEGMRQAMLHYRAVFEEMARMPEDREQMLEGRRETA